MSLRTCRVEGFASPPCERLTVNNVDKGKLSLKIEHDENLNKIIMKEAKDKVRPQAFSSRQKKVQSSTISCPKTAAQNKGIAHL